MTHKAPWWKRHRDVVFGVGVLAALVAAANVEIGWKAARDKELREADGPQFHGYPCTQDCSGHRAGFDWASRKKVTRPADCEGDSQSFIEGCLAFVDGR